MDGDLTEAEWERLKARAARLVHPDAQYQKTQYDYTPEQNIAYIAEAIARVPSVWLDAIEQDGTRIYPVRHGESLAEVSRVARRDAVNLPTDFFNDIEGMHIREERTVYAIDPSPDTIVHELGHAIDWIIGSRGDAQTPATPNSYDDPLLTFLQATKQEQLNDYAKTNVRESFAEYFRASTDTRSSAVDPSEASPRKNAQVKGPSVIDYLDRIQLAAELLLARDPNAFGQGRDVDLRLEVVERALVSAMKQIPVEEIFIDELAQRRESFRSRLELPDTTNTERDRDDAAAINGTVFHVDGHIGWHIVGRLGTESTKLDSELFPPDVKAGDSFRMERNENGDIMLSKIVQEQDVSNDFLLER